MKVSKIISLSASIFYITLLVYSIIMSLQFYKTFNEANISLDIFYRSVLVTFGILGIFAFSNLAYYLFLRKKAKEGRILRYATLIALVLALAPFAVYIGMLINSFRIENALM